MEQAVGAQSVGGLAFAAKSCLVLAGFVPDVADRGRLLERARQKAEEALDKNPDHVEAMIYLVIASGLQSRHEGRFSPAMIGEAKTARDLLVRAIELEPTNPWALAALGGWHGEIVRIAGPAIAASLFEASTEEADGLYRRALAAAPDNDPVRLEYVKFLLNGTVLHGEHRLLGIKKHLENIMAHPPSDAFHKIIKDHASQIRKALRSRKMAQVVETLRRLDMISPK